MRQHLILLCLFFTILYGNSQQFTAENLKTSEQIEVALDSAYQWMENSSLKEFIVNKKTITEAVNLSGNKEFQARLDGYKSVFFYYLYDYNKFDFFLNKSLSYYINTNNNEMLIYLYNMKGIYETSKYNNEYAAIKWREKAIDLIDGNSKNSMAMSIDLYFNLAISSYKVNDYEKSYKAASKCIELANKFNVKSRLARMYFFKGMSLFHNNDIKGALENFKICEQIVKEKEATTGNKVYYKDAAYQYGLSEVYLVIGDYEKSARYLKEYNARMSERVDPHIREVGSKIKENSDLLVDVATVNEIKAQEELEKVQLLYNLLILGFALLVIIGLVLFIFQQRKHQKINIKKNTLLTSKNEEVENALKVKTDFLNSITHELRTPLYAINSITQSLSESDVKDIDSTQIEILSFSGDHLLRFINDVIDFNIGSERFEFQNLNFEDVDLKNVLYNIKKTIQFSIKINNENSYIFNIDNTIPKLLKLDTLKLSRIIINLLNNASNNTTKGEVSLAAKQLDLNAKSSTIKFSIKDTGVGISKKQLSEIYLAFNDNLNLVKRIDERASGLGLGLVMVNRLLKLYKSKLIIETEEGVGTTMSFTVKFNLTKAKVKNSPSDLKAINSNKKQGHILIVDDNKINQMVTSRFIKNQGFTYDVVDDGYKAIDAFNNNNNYDFILMDIMMPGIDGFETTKRIKAISPKQKIVALTAISIGSSKQRFIDSGFDEIIEKPFRKERFHSVIDSLFAKN